MTKRIAIVGGGMAGIAAAYELAMQVRAGADVEAVLFEAGTRLGGIVETVREGGYVIECGPDGWVTDKPWARELALELGLEDELSPSLDATRKTYVMLPPDDAPDSSNSSHTSAASLVPIPDGMRMMVPADLDALNASPLFSNQAKQAYHDEIHRAAELKSQAPAHDESVASFVRRHFGEEVLTKIGAPLLSGVFGGNVETLSVRSVMAPFVAMEREHGSLILALQARQRSSPPGSIFTSLRSGVATLTERMIAAIPPDWIRLGSSVKQISHRSEKGWTIDNVGHQPYPDHFDALFLATPADAARALLQPLDHEAAALIELDASSAVVAAFAFPDASRLPLPAGFGFLVPPGSRSLLLACTFVDQKFPARVPPGGRILRAFFGGAPAERLMRCSNDEVVSVARLALAPILGPMPEPEITVVRRWPRSLPQYAVGHLERMAQLDQRVARLPGLYLLGNAYRGVGLPDLIRDSRAAARTCLAAKIEA
jgi:oxygen-dependent protoporphyrinogen oxidase